MSLEDQKAAPLPLSYEGSLLKVVKRSTRECKFGDLQPEMAAAIRKHMNTYALGNIETSLLICCETTTRYQKTGLFASGFKSSVTVMCITPQLLVWIIESGRGEPVVKSAWLRNIDVQDFENTAMYRVNPDSGMNISGRFTDVNRQGQTFLGLGPNPAGEKFRQVLQHAIQKVAS